MKTLENKSEKHNTDKTVFIESIRQITQSGNRKSSNEKENRSSRNRLGIRSRVIYASITNNN